MDERTILDFEQQLRLQLAGVLPGPMVQRQLAPELAFGRHRGPLPYDARQAAVLMLVHPAEGDQPLSAPSEAAQKASFTSARDWIIPAIIRPDHMKFHPGQIAIPGGIVEPGETALDAALREFEEELGVSVADIRLLGQLSPIYVFASRAQIVPFVGFLHQRPIWKPNPEEVAAVIDIRLADLVHPGTRGSHCIRRGKLTMRAPHFEIAAHRIWGATAMILAEFAAICSAARLHLAPQSPSPTPDAT